MTLSEEIKKEGGVLQRVGKGAFLSLVLVALLVTFTGGYAAGNASASKTPAFVGGAVEGREQPAPSFLSKDVPFSLMWDVWKHAKEDYVTKGTPDTQLFYGALAGVVASLGDPYSTFFDPDTAKRFNEDLSGSFDGIGAEIGAKNKQLVIIAPLPGTPAEQAGLRAGDAILAIDKQSTAMMSVDEAVSLIRGKKGTQVVLTIYRQGDSSEQKVSITRDTIAIASVTWSMKEGGVGYIKIAHFNKDTKDKFAQAVRELLDQKAGKIVLDLRNDPGGYLDTAVNVAGYWIGAKPAVIEKEHDERETPFVPDTRPILKDTPTVVLVNGGSASASEIVAGALQDYGKAKVVGTQTFGKGSVQNVIPLSDGSALKLTIAKWYTPKGKSIHEVGITPDEKVDVSAEDFEEKRDPQLDKALEMLK